MNSYRLLVIIVCLTMFSCKDIAEKSEVSQENGTSKTQKRDYKTYCNPIDIDYSYMSHYRAKNKLYQMDYKMR